MIDLNEFPKVVRDVEGSRTSLTPLVVIAPDTEDPIYISTVKGSFDANIYFEDRNLQLPSIKESINLQTNKFQINNLTFTVSNYTKNNQRFSDFVYDKNLMNESVDVYYKTQSCQTLDDCLLVYRGNIRRFTHDEKVCKVQLEDVTEDKLTMKVPRAQTGYRSNVYNDDYVDKPIPILYGKVEKAPAIPFLEESVDTAESIVKVICDDTLGGDNKRIEVGTFFPDEVSEGFLSETGNINPLYIYKGDYFQVLEKYDGDKILDTSAIADSWNFVSENQYSRIDGEYIEILKEFDGLTAKNPPANNEFHTVKVRYPNALISLRNPVNEDAIIDENFFSVTYAEHEIKAPELAFDNPFEGNFKSSNFLTDYQDTHLDTFAQIPDRTDFPDIDTGFITQDFKPYQTGYMNYEHITSFGGGSLGGMSPDVDSVEKGIQLGQHEAMTFLMRYAHVQNSLENPVIQFVKAPHGKAIRDRVNAKLWEELSGVNVTLERAFSYYTDRGLDLPLLIEDSSVRINVATNIDRNVCQLWADANGLNNYYNETTTYYSGTYDNYVEADQQLPNPYNRVQYGVNFLNDYVKFNYNGKLKGLFSNTVPENFNYTDVMYYGTDNDDEDVYKTANRTKVGEDSFTYLCNDGSAQGRTGNNKVNHPPFMMQWQLKTQVTAIAENQGQFNFDPRTALAVEGQNLFRCTVGLKNENINLGDYNSEYIGRFFNLIDLEDGEGGLYQKDDLARYIPIDRTHISRTGIDNGVGGRAIKFEYSCGWNGTHESFGDDGYTGNYGSGGAAYFGGMIDYPHYNGARENEILSNGTDTRWFMWISEPIMDANPANFLGSGSVLDFEYMLPLQHLRVAKNTLISCVSREYANSSGYLEGENFNTGYAFAADLENIQVSKTDNSSRRYSLILPFKDQDIEDDVKTDTFFALKTKLNFDQNGTTNSNVSRFKIKVNGVDVDEDEPTEIGWESFDSNMDLTGATIFDETLANIIDKPTVELNTFQENIDSDESTTIFDNPLERIADDFHQVNNYNAIGIFFRNTDGSDVINIETAAFNVQLFNAAMIHYIVFQGALDSPFYVNCHGRIDTSEDARYAGQFDAVIENPANIAHHLVEQEFQLDNLQVDIDSIQDSAENSNVSKFAFSVNENIKGKDLFQKMFSNSNLFALFRGTSQFSMISIKDEYSSSDATILAKDVLKYTFNKTPLEQIHTLVNVKYKKDYATGEYLEQTGYVDGYDMFGNADSTEGFNNGYSYDYLGLDREDKILEFEADFIRNRADAINLRNYLYLYNCNQHNIFKLTLPLKYIYLEVGDIIQFDSLIDNLKIYGEDYTGSIRRNGQIIYPFFIISSINKKQKHIEVELTQLHQHKKTFIAGMGSVSRRSNVNGDVMTEDLVEFGLFLDGLLPYFTEEQKRVADLNFNGYLDEHDEILMHGLSQVETPLIAGDLTGDEIVNVIDIVRLVNLITSGDITPEQIEIIDTNNDGEGNVIDLVGLVNQILNPSITDE